MLRVLVGVLCLAGGFVGGWASAEAADHRRPIAAVLWFGQGALLSFIGVVLL